MQKETQQQQIERFEPDFETGLTEDQVASRKSQNLTNVTNDKFYKTYANIFISNIFTYFNILAFIVLAAIFTVSLLSGKEFLDSFSDMFFIFIILFNSCIGIIQEIKGKRTIQKLKLLSQPKTTVVRDGKYIEIDTSEIVLDDVIMFSQGNQIVADSKVLSGYVSVNESLLTGESDLISKTVGDVLYSGSYIEAGSCYAKADKIGNESFVSKLSSKAKKYQKPNSEIMKSLKSLLKVIGFVIPILGALMFLNNFYLPNGGIYEVVSQTAGVVIGLIPAGLFLLSTLVLFLGAVKLAKHKCLVQDIYCIEMLARVDILCVDKTGTITDGKMSVKELVALNNKPIKSINEVIGNMLNALTDNNHTALALKEYFKLFDNFTPVNVMPFSSVKKMSAVTFKKHGTYALGAPEFLIDNIDEVLKEKIEKYAKKGLRVLALAHSADAALSETMTPIALIIISDNVRDDAVETLKWFFENNVEVKVISGDNPYTVAEVAKRAGIKDGDKCISLEKLTDEEVMDAAPKYTVFGRVSPEQKAILIRTLKSAGHKVAMTGDGVNDILAMKEADCSISIASGSDAARNVSHLVLLNSDFSPMPKVVAEGRRVINNLQRSASLFLMKTIFVALLCVLVGILRQPYPFTPGRMLLLEFFIIGIGSFVLAFESNHRLVKGNFLLTIINNAIPAGIVLTLNIGILYALKGALDINFTNLSVIVMTFTGVVYLFILCIPFNLIRSILVVSVSAFIALGIAIVPPSFFDIQADQLDYIDFIIIGSYIVTSFFLIILLKFLSNKIKRRNPKINDL
ncbi:MAG: HAD-IC family P-type ATPase [Firmicutes bacterium]|nr:HAD-IC family P-type ATPase [Bacillota bacterium]